MSRALGLPTISNDLRDQIDLGAATLRTQVKGDLFDQTLGSLAYGAVDVAGNLLKSGGSLLWNDNFMSRWGQDLDQWKAEHPEYAPEEVDGALDLLKNPKALLSRVFEGIPQMLLVGLSVGPGGAARAALGAALAFGVESRRAWEGAKASGASDDQARASGIIKGAVNAALQVVPFHMFQSVAGGAKSALAREAAQVAEAAAAMGKISTKQTLGFIAAQAVFAPLQGTVDELLDKGIIGKPFAPGFLDRRLQEAIGAIPAASVFGLTKQYMRNAKVGADPRYVEEGTVIPEREEVRKFVKDSLKTDDEKLIDNVLRVVPDQIMGTLAENEGLTLADSYKKRISFGGEDRVPALRLPDGTVIEGKEAVSHADVYNEVLDSKNEPLIQSVSEALDKNTVKSGWMVGGKFVEKVEPAVVLQQSGRGAVQFGEDGKAILTAMQGADVSTVIHELGHILRRWLPENQQKTIFKWMGVEEAKAPTVEQEENFSKAFEHFFLTGGVEKASLRKPFDLIQSMMQRVYKSQDELGLGLKISPEVEKVFKLSLGDAVTPLEQKIQLTRNPGQPSYLDLKPMQIAEVQFDQGGPRERGFWAGMKSASDWMKAHAVSMWEAVRPSYEKRKIGEGISDVESYTQHMRGTLVPGLLDAYKGDKETVKFLETPSWIDTGAGVAGFTNARRMLDSKATPSPLEKIQSPIVDTLSAIHQKLMTEAEGARVPQKVSGVYVPFGGVAEGRLPRFFTNEFYNLVDRGGGPEYNALVKVIQALNPKAFKDFQSMHEALQGNFSREALTKKVGSLEDVRQIKVMPDFIKVGEQTIPLMETNLYRIGERWVGREARKIGTTRVFGHDRWGNVGDKDLKGFLEDIGAYPKVDESYLGQKLIALGIEPEKLLDPQSETGWVPFGRLKRFAEAVGISTKVDRGAMVEAIPTSWSGSDISKEAANFARKIGGIRPELQGEDLLQAIKDRSTEKLQGDVLKKMVESYRQQGYDYNYLRDAINVWQGVPIYRQGTSVVAKAFRVLSTAVGTMQTSMMAIPNLFQWMVLTPQYTGFKNLFKGMAEVVSKGGEAKETLTGLGVLNKVALVLAHEEGRTMDNLSSNLAQISTQMVGAKHANYLTDLVGGAAFKELADQWKGQEKFTSGDVQKMKDLHLTQAQIDEVTSGAMSDFTWRKIIQNGTAIINNREGPVFKSRIENWPMMRMIFSYSSYVQNMGRNIEKWFGQGREAVKGDPSLSFDLAKRMFATVTGAVGAGMATAILRDALKGRLGDLSEEDAWSKGMRALKEVAFLGPAQRMMDAVQYDQGMIEKTILGLTPQFKALSDYMAVLLGYGKYGRFDLPSSLWETTKMNAPALKGITNWVEQMAWPEQEEYRRTKGAVRKFSQETLGRESQTVGATSVNPVYFNIFQAIARNDREDVQKHVQKYYEEFTKNLTPGDVQEIQTKGLDPLEVARERLRSSLLSRAPINLNDSETVRFLNSVLDPEKRRLYLQTHTRYVQLVNEVAPARGRNYEGSSGF